MFELSINTDYKPTHQSTERITSLVSVTIIAEVCTKLTSSALHVNIATKNRSVRNSLNFHIHTTPHYVALYIVNHVTIIPRRQTCLWACEASVSCCRWRTLERLSREPLATSMKKALRERRTVRAGCSKAEPKIFAPPRRAPSRGRGTAQI